MYTSCSVVPTPCREEGLVTLEQFLCYAHHYVSSLAWYYVIGIVNVARIQARIPAIGLARAKTRLLTQHNPENAQLSPDPFRSYVTSSNNCPVYGTCQC